MEALTGPTKRYATYCYPSRHSYGIWLSDVPRGLWCRLRQQLSGWCCQTNENSHRTACAALIYALNSWRHSARAAVRLSLKLSRE